MGRLLGDNFRSGWTRKVDTGSARSAEENSRTAPVGQQAKQSTEPTVILSGRSIYYGIMLYLAHFISHFWIAVFIHSAIFVYLSYTLICSCFGLSFRSFALITFATLVLSPISFYISFLMPDILAAYLIIGTIILAVFWNSLSNRDRFITCLIILFSVLSHVTHIILLLGLICVVAISWLLLGGRNRTFASIGIPVSVLSAIVLAALLGEAAYNQGVRLTTGFSPIRPPFVMGRLIEDGPGYRFLQNNCTERTYIICRYLDHMPITSEDFLWSHDPKIGIFFPADRETRQALSSEERSFAFDVLLSMPFEQSLVSSKNAIRELFLVGLSEFYADRTRLEFYQDIPSEYLEKLRKSRIVSNDRFLGLSETVFFSTYVISLTGLVLIFLFLLRSRKGSASADFWETRYEQMILIAMLGIMLNAVICGVFGGAFERYQTRVSWIPILILLLSLHLICVERRRPLTG